MRGLVVRGEVRARRGAHINDLDVAVARHLASDDAPPQQHRPDGVGAHQRRVRQERALDARVGQDQLLDPQVEALHEDHHKLPQLRRQTGESLVSPHSRHARRVLSLAKLSGR